MGISSFREATFNLQNAFANRAGAISFGGSTRIRARFHFESRGDYTLVQSEQTGWQSGEEGDKAYEYLFAGNAELLATLLHRLDGPIDWEKVSGHSEKIKVEFK